MGAAAGLLLGGGLLSIGASSMASKKQSYAASFGSTAVAAAPEAPTAPNPTATDGSATENALMEAEREKERQAALLRRQQAPEVFTSGLGAGGLAQTARKTLLGG